MLRSAALVALSLLVGPVASAQEAPPGYPDGYRQVIDAAKREGKVTIYSTTDAAQAAPLVDAFKARYPGVGVEYDDLNSTELYNRFIAEQAAGAGTGDLLWSSAMDLQVKLANDGYALTYESPETPNLPQWAVWRAQAYGTTAEPLAIVYNKRLVPEGDVPRSHAALLKLLQEKGDTTYKGKLAAYDPERSGVGFLQLTQDVQAWPQAWDLYQAFGKAQIKLYTSVGAMLERVGSGEHLIAYDVFGSYALARARKDPSIGWVLPEDFAVINSRVAIISSMAKAPNAAKLFLDYILSRDGQEIIANKADLYSLRKDVSGEATLKAVTDQLGDRISAVPIDDNLLRNLGQIRRIAFIRRWQQAVKGG